MDYTKFSGTYTVRRLFSDDIPSVFALCEKNPQYYEHCPPFVTPEKIEADLKAMPQRKAGQEQDKYYLGYFDVHQRLVAVMDFIDHYPDAQSGFIGFFMMEKDLQGTGVGSSIITELCACLAQWDYQYIRLGYVDGNEQSRSFWLNNQFTDTGLRDHTNNYTVVVMNRFLTKVQIKKQKNQTKNTPIAYIPQKGRWSSKSSPAALIGKNWRKEGFFAPLYFT